MLNHHTFTNLKHNIYNVPQETRLEEVLSGPCLSCKTTKLGQSLGLDRKNRGLVSHHGWHDKDPPPQPKDRWCRQAYAYVSSNGDVSI